MQSDKNIPPDVQIERDAVTIRCGERETVVTKDGIRIREQGKSYPALKRLVRLLSANFTNSETVLRLEYEGSDRNVGKRNTCRCRADLRGHSDTPHGQGV